MHLLASLLLQVREPATTPNWYRIAVREADPVKSDPAAVRCYVLAAVRF